MGVRFEPEPENHLAVITIDRPEARNAVNAEVAQGIEEAVDAIEADDRIWVGILTGVPPVFSAGGDLKEIGKGRVKTLHTKRGGFAGFVRRERRKPFIAAVDGYALAGGTELALACDLVVASRGSTFGIPEVKRAVVAGAGGLFRLGRRIPFAVAMEWALTGDAYPAERAAELGLVNELAESGKALEAARALAARITVNAPVAVQLSRRLMLEATHLVDEDEAWERNRAVVRAAGETEDFAEGMKAFVEKRAPLWTGR